jgi:hypothetical protein
MQTTAYPVMCNIPQESVLGLAEFAAYTEDVINVTRLRSVNLHACTDDMQLYTSLRPRDIFNVRRHKVVTSCIAYVTA